MKQYFLIMLMAGYTVIQGADDSMDGIELHTSAMPAQGGSADGEKKEKESVMEDSVVVELAKTQECLMRTMIIHCAQRDKKELQKTFVQAIKLYNLPDLDMAPFNKVTIKSTGSLSGTRQGDLEEFLLEAYQDAKSLDDKAEDADEDFDDLKEKITVTHDSLKKKLQEAKKSGAKL